MQISSKYLIYFVFFLLILGFPISSFSNTTNNKSNLDIKIVGDEGVKKNNPFANELKTSITHLVNKIENNSEEFAKNSKMLYSSLDNYLLKMIDFDRFAYRVSSRYKKQITPDQYKKFSKTIKMSLFNSYVRGFTNSSNLKNISKGLVIEINKELRYTNERKTRAFQDMKITKNSKKFMVSFSIYQTPEKKWMIENVIVEGINLGLNYRSQFNALMSKYKNMDKVIANWSAVANKKSK